MPGSGFQIFYALFSAFLASKIRKSRCIIIACLLTICIVGSLMIRQIPTEQKYTRLGGLWLLGAYAAGFPLSLSLISSNVAGFTKKTTVSAIMFVGYCAGNIAGPQVFLSKEAPRYQVYISCLAPSLPGIR
jgi:MFS transporter, ACS family, allantoate permease